MANRRKGEPRDISFSISGHVGTAKAQAGDKAGVVYRQRTAEGAELVAHRDIHLQLHHGVGDGDVLLLPATGMGRGRAPGSCRKPAACCAAETGPEEGFVAISPLSSRL